MDNLRATHTDSMANDEFLNWLKKKYANDNIRAIKSVRDKNDNYLETNMDYSITGVASTNIDKYANYMAEESPKKLEGTKNTQQSKKLFKV